MQQHFMCLRLLPKTPNTIEFILLKQHYIYFQTYLMLCKDKPCKEECPTRRFWMLSLTSTRMTKHFLTWQTFQATRRWIGGLADIRTPFRRTPSQSDPCQGLNRNIIFEVFLNFLFSHKISVKIGNRFCVKGKPKTE